VEQTLARIWGELLKHERVGRDDNFFELGGHSLMAITMIERMQRAGCKMRVSDLFAMATLAGLALAVEPAEPQFVTISPEIEAGEAMSEEIVL